MTTKVAINGFGRSLALKPEILIADEPVSALDISIQAQILDLLEEIRDQMNLSMIFITHDLRVAAQVCDRLAVMRYGEVVETGATADIFANPQHGYTRDLLTAVPGKDWKSSAKPKKSAAKKAAPKKKASAKKATPKKKVTAKHS